MSVVRTCCHFTDRFIKWTSRIPYSLVALLGRFAISGVFWRSGQTKVEELSIDLLHGKFHLGIPRLSDSAVALFRNEYQLPFIAPEHAAVLAAVAEHLFPVMLLIGLGTRFAALALLIMTAIIQIFVYPSAWPTHGTWAAVMLMLLAMGPGRLSFDCLLSQKRSAR